MPFRPILIYGGFVVFVLGAFFMAQGAGWVPWPRQSFMVGAYEWVVNGAFIAVAGLMAILLGRRLRR